MLLHTDRNQFDSIRIYSINGVTLKKVCTEKNLGAGIDKELTIDRHIAAKTKNTNNHQKTNMSLLNCLWTFVFGSHVKIQFLNAFPSFSVGLQLRSSFVAHWTCGPPW